MTIQSLRDHVARFISGVEESVHNHIHTFVAFVEAEEAKIAAAIAELEGRGYTVTKPSDQTPTNSVN